MVFYGVLSMATGSRLRGRYVPKNSTANTDDTNLLTVQRGLEVAAIVAHQQDKRNENEGESRGAKHGTPRESDGRRAIRSAPSGPSSRRLRAPPSSEPQ